MIYHKINKMNKRGVSPLIATVLLVAMTITIFLAIFAFSKGFISEQVEKLGGPIANSCQDISFDAIKSNNIVMLTNKGNVVIYGFNVKAETKGTSKLTFLKSESGKLGIGEVDRIDISGITGDTITVVPVLLGKGIKSGTGKLQVCDAQGKVV